MSANRKPRTIAPFIAGTWAENCTFHPSDKQPTEPIGDVAAMVRWAKANLISETEGGRVDFIRKAGTLNVVPRTVTRSEFTL